MKYLYTFFAILVVLILLDAIWLKLVMSNIFKSELGDLVLQQPRLAAAGIFYVMYAAGVLAFVVSPTASTTWMAALMWGGLFGLIAYGTYDLTNMATLKPWTWKLASIDMAWGCLLTALSAVAGRAVFVFAR